MRKKIFTFLLALVASVGLSYAAPDASGSCGANVTYSFNGATGAMTITGTGPMTDFANKSDAPWDSYRTSITSVTITDGVTSVGKSSFGQCTSLTTVTIGNDVETIGEWAFNDCGEQFTSLTLGNSIRTIGNYAFLFGTGITGFTLPSTLETIGDYAFCQNRAITTLTIPSNVTSIGKLAFYNCNALTSITTEATTPPTLKETVFDKVPTSIPLNVPNGSVAAYTAAAQWNAFNIQGYDPAPGGGSAPANVCGDGLTWELSEGVLTISYDGVGTGEMYDFGYEYDQNPVNVAPWKENKSAITTVIVGDGVKSIGNYAFNDLYENFTAVTIANSVERIGVFAFTNAKWITEITLPSSLKTIDEQCFAANFGITSITIPSGVTSIGYKAFSYCTGLTSLTCEATTPPTLDESVFYKIRSTTSSISSIPLYVPSASVTAYEAAAQWNAFDIQGYDPAPTPTTENSITINGTSHGSVVASSSSAAAGETITLTATPDEGYQLKSISGVYEAQGPLSETLNATSETVNGNKFQAQATSCNLRGWRVYNPGTANTLTVSSLNGTTLIEKIEFTSTWGASRTNNMLSVSKGTLSFDGSDPSTTVTINDINATSVTISGSGNNAGTTWCISSVKIYYTGTIEKELEISDTENANVKTFTMVDSEVTISAEFEPAPEPEPQGQIISGGQDPQNTTYYYSTFFDSQVSYLLPAGVEAYVATISDNALTLTKIAVAGQTIPANNAVIFRANAENFTLTVSDAAPVSFTATNSLRGVDAETTVTDIAGLTANNCYVLSGGSEDESVTGVGFYRISGSTLLAHKAYVQYNATSGAPKRMRFVFPQEQMPTGIDETNTADKAQKVMENGTLYIIRDGVRYNATGQIAQ